MRRNSKSFCVAAKYIKIKTEQFLISFRQMPRSHFLQNPNVPYHITGRSINREWFTDISNVWNLFEDYLFYLKVCFEIDIFAFVLMNNHYHLIARFPEGNLSKAMGYLMRETSRQIAHSSGRINQIWGSRFFRSSLDSHHYYLLCYKYVYRNPIEAGICKNAEDYPYSTLHGLVGKAALRVPVSEDTTLFSDFSGTINWINKNPKQENLEAVRLALKKPSFKLPHRRSDRTKHILENDLL